MLKWEDVPIPEYPPDQVFVQIKASSINHLDIWVRNGLPVVILPIILGSDGSGVIAEVGDDVDGWEVGDEIIIEPGTYCGKYHYCRIGMENYCDCFGIFGETEDGIQREFVLIELKYLEKKPEHISFVEAAVFPLVFLT